MTDLERYDLPGPVYEAYKAILAWEPKGKWNQRMRRKALRHLSRISIFGGRPRG